MSRLKFVSLCCLLLAFVSPISSAPSQKGAGGPVVTLPQGDVEGVVRSTGNGKSYNAFLGIPYGTAGRFEAPVAAGPWTGVLNATTDPPYCLQPIFTVPISPDGVEDCLTLSVFTPSLTGGPLKVHVFIHGGAFIFGSIYSTKYGPDRLFDYTDIVVVHIQYRLGALGFLSTNDASAPGNFGLRDQNLGLQWVRNNIAFFNGNPNAITLSGESAGSVSVVSHILSPYSTGLFEQAICESGSALNGWAYVENPLQYAQKLGDKFSCDNSSNQALIDCLKLVPAEDITLKQIDIIIADLKLPWVPTVDGDFIPDDPLTLLQTGRFNKVPMIQGFNHDEGAIVYMFVSALFKNINDFFFDNTLPLAISVLTDYKTNLINISYAIKDQYYNIDVNDPAQVDRASIDLISDMIIISGSVQTAELASQFTPVHLYQFEYYGNFSLSYFTGHADATHTIELLYVYNNTEDAPPLDAEDTAFSQRVVQLWGDFETTGDPTPAGSAVIWPTTPAGQSTYLSIAPQFVVNTEFEASRMNFWLVTVPEIAAA